MAHLQPQLSNPRFSRSDTRGDTPIPGGVTLVSPDYWDSDEEVPETPEEPGELKEEKEEKEEKRVGKSFRCRGCGDTLLCGACGTKTQAKAKMDSQGGGRNPQLDRGCRTCKGICTVIYDYLYS